jgi:hypothetical protein
MGCGCGGTKAQAYTWVFTNTQTGESKTYNNETEAMAAVTRAKGDGVVRKVAA